MSVFSFSLLLVFTFSFLPSTFYAFSVSLHPGLSLQNPPLKPHVLHSLAQSHVGHDAARANWLSRKLHLAVNGDSALRPESIATVPVISGLSQLIYTYFARFSVGSPNPKPYYFTMDPGSDVVWLQCEPCVNCYTQQDPIFNPTQSSSYRPLSCNSRQCRNLGSYGSCQQGNKCSYYISYYDKSYSTGDFATETLSFEISGAPVPNIAIGCGHNSSGLFKAAGLVGMAKGPAALPAQLKAKSFSYCLVNFYSNSSSTLEFDSPRPSGSLTIGLLSNTKAPALTYYYVQLTGLRVNGRQIPVSPDVFKINDVDGTGGVILDSGTATTALFQQVYEQLRDAVKRESSQLPAAPANQGFETCYYLDWTTYQQFPKVAFEFENGKLLPLPTTNTLIQIDAANGIYCLAFKPAIAPFSIIGSFQQQRMRIHHDLVNSILGFKLNQC